MYVYQWLKYKLYFDSCKKECENKKNRYDFLCSYFSKFYCGEGMSEGTLRSN